jgi:hypothetical protein
MGLDVIGISGLIVEDGTDTDMMSEMGLDIEDVYINRDFMSHVPELEKLDIAPDATKVRFVSNDTEHSFSAGSYRTYNNFRSNLCQLIYGVNPETVWESHTAWTDSDFYYLIDFSDCQGFMTKTVCERLYQDFVKWEHKVEKEWRDKQEFAMYNIYMDFKKALDIAQTGILIFT